MVRFAEKPTYEDKERKIAFIRNLDDHPDGYYVRLGEESDDRGFALPSRVLPGMTRPETDTWTMWEMMNAMDRGLMDYIQEFSGIRPAELHYHLLRLRNRELEDELEYFDPEAFKRADTSPRRVRLEEESALSNAIKDRNNEANDVLRQRIAYLEKAINEAITRKIEQET